MRLRAARALLLPVLDAPTKSGAPTVFGDGLGPACLEGTALANSARGPTPPPVDFGRHPRRAPYLQLCNCRRFVPYTFDLVKIQ